MFTIDRGPERVMIYKERHGNNKPHTTLSLNLHHLSCEALILLGLASVLIFLD
jgi:hypothetical protein